MSSYRRYKQARDAAWRTLIFCKCASLPVDPRSIAEKMHIEIHPFPTVDQEPRLHALLQRNPSALAASLRIQGAWHIFFQENCGERLRCFALAHELGHIILRHEKILLAPRVEGFCGIENEGDLMSDPQDPDDYFADSFAVRLLSPACVLHELHADDMGKIARLCNLPPEAAQQRAERMETLNLRDAFLISPLEQKVLHAFQPFILCKRGSPSSVLCKENSRKTALGSKISLPQVLGLLGILALIAALLFFLNIIP